MSVSTTPFQDKVYAAARQVPRGRVTTYKHLARYIGCGSSQAVGQALKHNPFAPNVPCHRVVKSDLSLGGFSGRTEGKEVRRKRRLLLEEGVRFEGERVAEGSVFAFGTSKVKGRTSNVAP